MGFLERPQGVRDGHGRQEERGRVKHVVEDEQRVIAHEQKDEFLRVDDADDVVGRLFPDGQSGVAAVADDREDFVPLGPHVEARHFVLGHHAVDDRLVGQGEDVPDEIGLFGVDQPGLFGVFDEES